MPGKQHQNHQQHLDLFGCFPKDQYPVMRENQREALEIIGKQEQSVTLELPTGSGKTAIGYAFLKALQKQGGNPLFYIAPTKAIIDQVHTLHPEVSVVYGRNEHPCLYYPDEKLKADEIPCSLLKDCAHRVDQDTGQTHEDGAAPCPYLLQKFQAKHQQNIVACTAAFYLFTHLFTHEWKESAGLVIDEAHQLAAVVRNALSFEITDYHLKRAVELLQSFDPVAAAQIEQFLEAMLRVIRNKPAYRPTLLEDHEIAELMDALQWVDQPALLASVSEAVRTRVINPREQREVLKQLEVIMRDLSRYLRALEYSRATDKRHALNYTFASYEKEREKGKRVQHRLHVKAYYVAPIIQRILSPFTVAYSATIGDPEIFGHETGIKFPFYTMPSPFPIEHARIYLPSDTPNLAMKVRIKQEPTKVLRKIARACRHFADAGQRSLVVVVSEKEREKFLMLCKEERVAPVSYGNGTPAREAVAIFRQGTGDCLVGTVSQYGEGIDLPKGIAPIIFFLRPAYPIPSNPETMFEERRFGNRRWAIWNWRVIIEACQVRGRNIRAAEEIGMTFFISQQFRRFIPMGLPEWLRPAYRGNMKFDACVTEVLDILGRKVS